MRYQSDCREIACDDSYRHLLHLIKEEQMTHELQRQMLVHVALLQMRFDRVATGIGSGRLLERRRLGYGRAIFSFRDRMDRRRPDGARTSKSYVP